VSRSWWARHTPYIADSPSVTTWVAHPCLARALTLQSRIRKACRAHRGSVRLAMARARLGAVLEVELPDEVAWDRLLAAPAVRAALDAVPDPIGGLLAHRGRGGGSGGPLAAPASSAGRCWAGGPPGACRAGDVRRRAPGAHRAMTTTCGASGNSRSTAHAVRRERRLGAEGLTASRSGDSATAWRTQAEGRHRARSTLTCWYAVACQQPERFRYAAAAPRWAKLVRCLSTTRRAGRLLSLWAPFRQRLICSAFRSSSRRRVFSGPGSSSRRPRSAA
jgi:hypothetical protein